MKKHQQLLFFFLAICWELWKVVAIMDPINQELAEKLFQGGEVMPEPVVVRKKRIGMKRASSSGTPGRSGILKRIDCKINSQLTELVSNSPTRSIMYIITHNPVSDQLAMQYRDCYGKSWINVARLPKSIYFESIIYDAFFPRYQSEWESYDYVITATYKTLTRSLLPRYMPLQTFNDVKELLTITKENSYDVLPFFRDFEPMMPTSVKYHTTNFLKAWNLLLVSLGYSVETISQYYDMKAFYRNAFIIKPNVLKGLMKFMQQAYHNAENVPEIKKIMTSDAHYVLGKREIAMEIFNTSYYQLHPFIFERLPAFYLYAHNHTVCTGPDSPCKYNYKG
jgi:hypothetical protein